MMPQGRGCTRAYAGAVTAAADGPAGAAPRVRVIDLNADVGESFGIWRLGADEELLEVMSSVNVACGFHAGDPATLARTVDAAVARGVAVGAQVSYPDLAGFGRREMAIAPEDLTACVIYQIGALSGFARAAGGRVGYVKPHGALYNRAARDPEQARAVADAVRRYDASLPVLTLPGSALQAAAEAAGVPAVAEGFADRAYRPDGTLVPRGTPGAVLDDPAAAARQGLDLAGRVRSLCVHSDTPGAGALARRLRAALEGAGWRVAPFTGGPAGG
jgi:UPF0271 protein